MKVSNCMNTARITRFITIPVSNCKVLHEENYVGPNKGGGKQQGIKPV